MQKTANPNATEKTKELRMFLFCGGLFMSLTATGSGGVQKVQKRQENYTS